MVLAFGLACTRPSVDGLWRSVSASEPLSRWVSVFGRVQASPQSDGLRRSGERRRAPQSMGFGVLASAGEPLRPMVFGFGRVQASPQARVFGFRGGEGGPSGGGLGGWGGGR